MIIILCLLFLLLPSSKASALTITVDGLRLSKVYITSTGDPVVNRHIDFFIQEIKHVSDIRMVKHSIKSSKQFITISDKRMMLPHEFAADAEKIKDDGFLLTIERGTVFIKSTETLGLIYGINEFMELLGFRYYMPGPYGTVYPTSNIHVNKQKIISNPVFKYRSVGKGEWSLFAYRSNVNIVSLPEHYGKRIFGVFHTFDLLLPEQKYFPEHPEYYAKRKLWDLFNKKGRLQLNTMNPAVIELIAKNMADLSKEDRYEMLTLGPNDHRRFDMSVASLRMDEWGVPSDQKMSKRLFIFYNAVAKKYKEMGGTLPVRIGAYDIYTAPPQDEEALKLESGLIPYIAHFNYCQLHAIEDKQCKPNRRFSEILNRWGYLGDSLFIYEYAYKHNWLELPWPIYVHAVPNIKYYKNNGAIGYFTQFSEENVFSNILNYYITAKALWNPSLDYDKVRSDFFSLFYPGVSEKMERCYTLLENEFANAPIDISGDARRNFTRIFKEDTLKKALFLAEDASRHVHGQKVKARVDMMVIWLKYSLSMRQVIEGKNRQQHIQEIASLLKESEKKGYPIFNKKVLLKPGYLGKFVTFDSFLSYYNSY